MLKPILWSAAVASAIAGCYRGATPPPTTVTPPPTGGAPLVATTVARDPVVFGDTGAGPVLVGFPGTVDALQARLPKDYRVEVKDDAAFTGGFSDFSPSRHLNVYYGPDRVFAVVLHEDTIFNIHTDSAKVGVQGHPSWHVNASFQDSGALSRCDCWGSKVVCWKDGEHVALAFDRGCDNLSNLSGAPDPRALRVLDGLQIKRMIWNPKPFVPEAADTTTAPEHKGGGLTGTVVPHQHPTQGDDGGDDDGGDDDGD